MLIHQNVPFTFRVFSCEFEEYIKTLTLIETKISNKCIFRERCHELLISTLQTVELQINDVKVVKYYFSKSKSCPNK